MPEPDEFNAWLDEVEDSLTDAVTAHVDIEEQLRAVKRAAAHRAAGGDTSIGDTPNIGEGARLRRGAFGGWPDGTTGNTN